MMKKITRQDGFTIIELMIATAVLSTILVLVTIVMVNIGTLYYKGINQSRVQDNARSIVEDITQNIQLNGQAPIGPVPVPGVPDTYAYCVGSVRYTFVLGVQISHTPPVNPPSSVTFSHVLWRDTNPIADNCPTTIDPSDPSSMQVDLTDPHLADHDKNNRGSELITNNSRLITFSITNSSLSQVSVGVAYGDNDLLCNPGVSIAGVSTCDNSAQMPQGAAALVSGVSSDWPNYTGNVLCKGDKGNQFCSTAQLNVSVVSRATTGSF